MRAVEILEYLDSEIVGRSVMLETPFGQKLELYADYTASGQELHFINGIVLKICDLYANTHTETSATGAYMNHLLHEAENEILRCTKADPKHYFVVGSGSGSTSAIEMTQKFLGTYIPSATRERLLKAHKAENWPGLKSELRRRKELPLVIVSHYEHHSNEVTWRNQLCDVIECPPRLYGHISIDRLNSLLRKHAKSRNLIIGSMSAGSNVTGIKTDVEAVAQAFKNYPNTVIFFDYAAVGPYIPIDLSLKAKDRIRRLIDGIYISPHKFLGGPGSCGLLVFNRSCYNGKIEPSHGGGGTVDFVNAQGQVFTEDPIHREKSGTPGILQIIKAGLAFQLKSIIQPVIDDMEIQHMTKFMKEASKIRNLTILGPADSHERVCIVSFLIAHPNGPQGSRYLHQNFVVKLLNDVFGIQGRSGCSCAGPYGHYLLRVDEKTSEEYKFWAETHPELNDHTSFQGLKNGWARVNLHYTFTENDLDYLIFAIDFISQHGPKFLPLYHFDPINGQWIHQTNLKEQPKFPKFGIDALLKEGRRFAQDESEAARIRIFDHQKQKALDLLETLPKSKGLDYVPEMPNCFFYVETGKLLRRNLLKLKGDIYEHLFGNAFSDLEENSDSF